MSNSCYESFKKYEVTADNIEDFLKKYTKYNSHEGRGKDYAEYRIKSFKEEFKKYGFCFILASKLIVIFGVD